MNNPRPSRRGVWRGLTAACALTLAGCAVGPDYQPPATADAPAQWKEGSPWKAAQPRDAEIKQKFWEIFSDPQLNAIEEAAAANNPDLAAAFQRIEQARAVARISQADFYPAATFDPAYSRTHYSQNRPVQPGSSVVPYTASDFVLPLDLSYEVDLWGRVRRSFRAARERAQASAADYYNILLALQSDVAETYFTIRSVDLNRRVVSETIDLRSKNLSLVQSLHQGGADSALDVAQAETELASAQADLVALNLRREQLENALAVLCGSAAGSFTLSQTTNFYRPPQIPVGLPAALLERRPDVAAAERLMAASSEGIGVAKAAFFPSIQLTGSAGVESADLRHLFDWESRAWALGPNVTLPIFEGGRNAAGLAQARAAYLESAAQYRSRVLVAFREVEDGLAGLRLLAEQFDDQMRALDSASRAADLSRLRYKEGLASYFEVVEADRTALESKIVAYELNGQRMITTIQLIKAMGGGWSRDSQYSGPGVGAVQSPFGAAK